MNKFINKSDADRGAVAIECFKTTVKQLKTSDGLGTLKGFYIGQQVTVVIMSLRFANLKTKTGLEHKKLIYDLIDVNGKPLGWIYAECLFPDMVVI